MWKPLHQGCPRQLARYLSRQAVLGARTPLFRVSDLWRAGLRPGRHAPHPRTLSRVRKARPGSQICVAGGLALTPDVGGACGSVAGRTRSSPLNGRGQRVYGCCRPGGPSMRCPTCDFDNPADATFCGECGAPLASIVSCPSCGRTNPPKQRFCNGCGRPLARPDKSSAPEPQAYTPRHDAPDSSNARGLLEELS